MTSWFFGELLARLECMDGDRLEQAETLKIRYTGAEANAALAMCALGAKNVELLSAVPNDALGRACLAGMRKYGAGVNHVVCAPGRLGTFYLETGAHLRPSQCIYDRTGSVFSRTPFAEYGVECLFKEGDWLHFSGTAPALSSVTAATVRDLLACAKVRGVTVSFDLNYRAKLWSEEAAHETFLSLMSQVDVLIANEGVATHFLGVPPEKLCATFGLKAAALTRREDASASRTGFGALLWRPAGCVAEVPVFVFDVLDRVGGGDAFAGAMIFALQHPDWTDAYRLAFAHACGVLKHETRGDFSLTTCGEIASFLAGEGAAVRR